MPLYKIFFKGIIPPETRRGNEDKRIDKIKGMLKRAGTRSFSTNIKNVKLNFIRKFVKEPVNDLSCIIWPPVISIGGTKYGMIQDGCGKQLRGWRKKRSNLKIIHSEDYDRVVDTNRRIPDHVEKHILYLDSGYIGTTYEFAISSVESVGHKNKETYFNNLEKLFGSLEKHYGIPVVIAGHPHTIYEDGDYSGRKIEFGKTCDLVKAAKLVVLNVSTAISFVLVYDKPFALVNSEVFDNITRDYIKWSSEVIGGGYIELENNEMVQDSWRYCIQADRVKRREYIEKYVIDNSTFNHTTEEYIEKLLQNRCIKEASK